MTETFANKFKTKTLVVISDEEYQQLLREVEIIEESETFFRDKIRILRSDNNLFIQEKSNKEEIIIRRTESVKEGQRFIQNRLAVYENMWNGCGCKIDYYS
jgi:hypothetical protein